RLVLRRASVSARFHPPHIVYNMERGPLALADLAGRRVGTRSYTVTTSTWLRSLLDSDYAVDMSRVRWVTFEDAHVAESRDPATVERAPEGKELTAMLLAGEIDAAILPAVPMDPRRSEERRGGEEWRSP